jgi:hypothetical protein
MAGFASKLVLSAVGARSTGVGTTDGPPAGAYWPVTEVIAFALPKK